MKRNPLFDYIEYFILFSSLQDICRAFDMILALKKTHVNLIFRKLIHNVLLKYFNDTIDNDKINTTIKMVIKLNSNNPYVRNDALKEYALIKCCDKEVKYFEFMDYIITKNIKLYDLILSEYQDKLSFGISDIKNNFQKELTKKKEIDKVFLSCKMQVEDKYKNYFDDK